MKKILLAVFILVCGFSYGQIVDIPDANFKKALINTKCVDLFGDGIGDRNADTNNDGEIDMNEALNVPMLLISDKNISSLKGLNSFKNLSRINCDSNKIEVIDFGELIYLRIVYCRHNSIVSLKNIDKCLDLQALYFENNEVDSLDLSKNKFLQNVTCENNKLKLLKFDQTSLLEYLRCTNNEIESLNLTKSKKLQNLYCDNNKLKKIDLGFVSQLKDLRFAYNQIDTIDLFYAYNLQTLMCDFNKLKFLDLGSATKLDYISAYENEIEYLNVKNNFKNTIFIFGNNPIKTICCDEFEVEEIKKFAFFKDAFLTQYCNFNPGGMHSYIKGSAAMDTDNDGCDSLDSKISYLKYNIANDLVSGSIFGNAFGEYLIPVPYGNYTINPSLENPQFFNITPPSIAVTFPTTSDTITQDFCITPKTVYRQIDITILPLSPPARPGFKAQFKVVITNKGNQRESGTINFRYDEALLDYVKADVNPSKQSDGLVAWDYKDFLPFESRTYTVTLKVNKPTDTPAVNAGDELQIVASILDNVFLLKNTVVGSYDPNDKTCLEGDKITPDMVGKYVHYLIRFENTGTYAAENVVVKDIIDEATFDLSSLQITDASHRAFTRINKSIVEFIFEGIQLPFDDANNDGYIAFKIKTKPTLKIGDELKNKANIYFDYNFPIVTNEAKSVISNIVSTSNFDINDDIVIYPNPAGDYINIGSAADVIKVNIYDLAGRLLQSSSVVNNQVHIKSLGTGTYLVKIFAKDGVSVKKMEKV